TSPRCGAAAWSTTTPPTQGSPCSASTSSASTRSTGPSSTPCAAASAGVPWGSPPSPSASASRPRRSRTSTSRSSSSSACSCARHEDGWPPRRPGSTSGSPHRRCPSPTRSPPASSSDPRSGPGSLAGLMDLDDVDYDLPPEHIAQTPVEPRDAARLLVDRGPSNPPEHRHVSDLADELGPGDVVVVNDTRVMPARLELVKPTGGSVEVLLLEPVDRRWKALVRPSRKVSPGTVLRPAAGAGAGLSVEVGEDLGDGVRWVTVHHDGDLRQALARHGQLPLPP